MAIPRRHVIAAAVSSAPWLAAPTVSAIPPGTRVTQLVVGTWITNSGLPQDSVRAIGQTCDGLLGVGPEAGLARIEAA
jgi:hypothetical protein